MQRFSLVGQPPDFCIIPSFFVGVEKGTLAAPQFQQFLFGSRQDALGFAALPPKLPPIGYLLRSAIHSFVHQPLRHSTANRKL